MATAVGGVAAMAGLGFGAVRGRKGSRGVRWLWGKEKGAVAMAHFIGHRARVLGGASDPRRPCGSRDTWHAS